MAVFNGGFPVGYQPFQFPGYQPPQPQQQAQPQMMTPPTIRAEIVQVEGEQAAAQYPVGAGASQMMMAKDDSAIFVKTALANGQFQLDIFDKRPPAPPEPPLDLSGFVRREEVAEMITAALATHRNVSFAEKNSASATNEEGPV